MQKFDWDWLLRHCETFAAFGPDGIPIIDGHQLAAGALRILNGTSNPERLQAELMDLFPLTALEFVIELLGNRDRIIKEARIPAAKDAPGSRMAKSVVSLFLSLSREKKTRNEPLFCTFLFPFHILCHSHSCMWMIAFDRGDSTRNCFSCCIQVSGGTFGSRGCPGEEHEGGEGCEASPSRVATHASSIRPSPGVPANRKSP